MIALRVWATLADGTRLHAGDIAFSDPDAHGRYESEFEYTENWLAHPDACDLDPESLRMARRLAVADKSVGEIGVDIDARRKRRGS